MNQELLSKVQTLRQSDPHVMFRWRHVDRKLEGFVGLSNLRLELVMMGNDQLIYSQSAPVMAIRDNLPTVIMQAENLVTITEGPRRNIVVQASKLRPEESGHQTSHTGITVIDESTPESLVQKVIELAQADWIPQAGMHFPALFRVSNKPETLTPNYTAHLRKLIDADPTDTLDELKLKFVANLKEFSSRTSSGWVIPFEYVFAGGMIVVDGYDVTKTGKQITYGKSYKDFKVFCEVNEWRVGKLDS